MRYPVNFTGLRRIMNEDWRRERSMELLILRESDCSNILRIIDQILEFENHDQRIDYLTNIVSRNHQHEFQEARQTTENYLIPVKLEMLLLRKSDFERWEEYISSHDTIFDDGGFHINLPEEVVSIIKYLGIIQ